MNYTIESNTVTISIKSAFLTSFLNAHSDENAKLETIIKHIRMKSEFDTLQLRVPKMDVEEIIKYNPHQLSNVTQTPRLCEMAIKLDWRTLEYVIDQTTELIDLALGIDGRALQFVKNQTVTLSMKAVRNNIRALKYIIDQTDDICKVAINTDAKAFKYIKCPSRDICMFYLETTPSRKYIAEKKLDFDTLYDMVQYDYNVINVIDAYENDLWFYCAIKKKPMEHRYTQDECISICTEYLAQDGMFLKYVPKLFQTPVLCMVGIMNNGLALQYVDEQFNELCLAAILNNPFALQWVKVQTADLCLLAVSINGLVIQHCKILSYQINSAAVTNNPEAINFMSFVPAGIRELIEKNNVRSL